MRVAVLGSSGAMGTFFAEYFRRRGHLVAGADVRPVGRGARGFRSAPSNPDAVRGADIVLVAVPMRDTAGLVREISPWLKPGSTLVEISSVKGRLVPELRRISKARKVFLLSVHPMFGPSSRSRRPKLVIAGGRRDSLVASRIFPDMDLIRLGPREHDRLMAYTLSLVHLANMAFVSAIGRGIGLQEFEKLASPTGLAQLDVAKAVLSQDPTLYSHIEIDNESVVEALSSFIAELATMRQTVEARDYHGFERKFAALAGEFGRPEMEAALGRIYAAESTSGRRKSRP